MNRQIARRVQYIRMVAIGLGCTLMLATKIYALTLNAEGEVPVTEDPIVDGETVPIDNGEIVNPDSGEPIAPEPHNAGGHGGHGETMGEGNFYINLSVVLFCTATAGLMSGLTIGLAAIDRLALEVKAVGNAQVKKMTERIFPVIDQHHWMLVTLLLCNAGAMETLPIFLDRMVPATAAIIISVTLILIFGEVIPQAICTGSQQLTIAYWMCPVVLLLMWLTAPVSWTIAKILDIWLGEHTFQRYDND